MQIQTVIINGPNKNAMEFWQQYIFFKNNYCKYFQEDIKQQQGQTDLTESTANCPH